MEEKEQKDMGAVALDELRVMFKAWLRRDFIWVTELMAKGDITGEEDEWDFLWSEWVGKFEDWMFPWVGRLRDTKFITAEEAVKFGEEAYNNMRGMLNAIYVLSGGVNNEQDN